MKNYFRNRWVAVTGATSGIGWAVALEIAQAGGSLIAIGRSEERLAKLASEWEGRRTDRAQRFVAMACDVRDGGQVSRLGHDILATCDLDMLIQSAGVSYPQFLGEIPDETIETLIATNLLAPIRLTRELLPHFQKRRSGHLAYLGSIAGELNIVGYSVYGASKAGLFAFADSLRNELVPYGIRVSIIHPADTKTPMLEGERRVRPAIVEKISAGGGVLPPEAVAKALLAGMAKGRFKLFPDTGSWALYHAFRLFPKLMRRYLDRKVRALAAQN